jgi:hypothetical protein
MPIKCVYDHEKFRRIADDQFNVVSRRQALKCGLSRSAIDYRIRDGGEWQPMLPGVYSTVTGTLTPDQRAMAALLYAGPVSIITGAAAVRRHRLTSAGLNEIDVLIPATSRVQSTGFVRVVRTRRMPESFYCTRKVRFAKLPRAVADAVRGMPRLSDIRALLSEATQKGKCELKSLVQELNEGPSAGSRHFRIGLTEIGDGIRSAAEADLRTIIIRSGLEPPVYNAELSLDDGIILGVADAWWQRAGVAAEVDSRQYHLSAADYEKTTLRHNRMQAESINMMHFLPSTLREDPDTVVRDLRKAIEAGNLRAPLPVKSAPARL